MEINLYNNNLTELTESDLITLCDLNNIKSYQLKELYLGSNKLKNINFIQPNTPFINLNELSISYNYEITDINNIKYLTNLEQLGINNLKLYNEKETIEQLKTMKKLKTILCNKTFKNYTYKQLIAIFPGLIIITE